MNKYHCPEDCESLTEVCVNQAVRDNLSSYASAHVRSEDVKKQKVLLCLKAYVPWHTWLTNLLTNSTTTCWKWAVLRGYRSNQGMESYKAWLTWWLYALMLLIHPTHRLTVWEWFTKAGKGLTAVNCWIKGHPMVVADLPDSILYMSNNSIPEWLK